MRGPRPAAAAAEKAAVLPRRSSSPPAHHYQRRRRHRPSWPLALVAAAALLLAPALVLVLVPGRARAPTRPTSALRRPVSVALAPAAAAAPPRCHDDDDDDDALPPSASSPTCLAGRCSPFSFDAAAAPARPAWMARLPDAAPLSSLSIPGTHDTMTYALAGDARMQCQNCGLAVQLAAGLRYLDVRARLRDDDLRLYHAGADTGLGLADVLRPLDAFLAAHPSEAVVVRLKDEGAPVGANNSLSFEQAFVRRLAAHPSAARRLHRYDPAAPLPALGALRSRFFLLQEFAAPDAGPYGLAWDGPRMALEDDWVVPDIYHLPDKWIAIRAALERAATEPLDNSRLYLAHVSASVGVLPVDAAAGPCNRSVTGMNDMTAQWLLDFDGRPSVTPRTGIVAFDFPGRRAIDAVLAWNKVPETPP